MTGPGSLIPATQHGSIQSADVHDGDEPEGFSSQASVRPERTESSYAGMLTPRASQEGHASGQARPAPRRSMREVSTSLAALQTAPASPTHGGEGIELAGADIERAAAELSVVVETIAREGLPSSVNSPASLWQHITGRLQTALAGAVTAGTTFGVFRGLGGLAIHVSSDPDYRHQLSASIRTVLLGGAAGGVGNTLAAAILTPAATAIMSQLTGQHTAFVAKNPEHLVPHDWPDRQVQIGKVKDAQSRFGIDSLTNIVAGVLSFGGGSAAKAAATVNAGFAPVANWGIGAATSAGAGAVTGLITDTFRGWSSIDLQGPDGRKNPVHLFEDVATAPKAVGESVRKAVGLFTGEGSLVSKAGQLGLQILARAGAVTASTLPLALAQAAVPALSESLQRSGHTPEQARQVASATMNLLGFAAVVGLYFKGLGMIGKTLPQRPPVLPQRRQQDPRPDSGAGAAAPA